MKAILKYLLVFIMASIVILSLFIMPVDNHPHWTLALLSSKTITLLCGYLTYKLSSFWEII